MSELSQKLAGSTKRILQIAFDLKQCTKCKRNLSYKDMVLCKECRIIVCVNCYGLFCFEPDHWHLKCSIDCEGALICSRHGNIFEYFCNVTICKVCGALEHNDHQTSDVVEEALQLLDAVSMISTLDGERIQSKICQLERRKDFLLGMISVLRSSLETRHDLAGEFIDTIFYEQSSKLRVNDNENLRSFVCEKETLEKLRSLLKNNNRKFSYHSAKEFNLSILNDYEKIKAALNIAKDLTFCEIYHPKITLTPRNNAEKDARNLLGRFLGELDSGSEVKFFRKDGTCAMSFLVYENEESFVKDVCYDSSENALCIFRTEQRRSYFIKLHENGMHDSFEIEVGDQLNLSPNISLVLLKNEIMLYTANVLLITEGMKSCKEFCFPFCLVQDIKIICSSKCKKYIFVYCSNNNVYRFEALTKKWRFSKAKLAILSSTMRVSQDLEYIAFSGNCFGEIYVFSFFQRTPLIVLHVKNSIRLFATFLTNDVLIACDGMGDLRWFDVFRKQVIKEIKYRNIEGDYIGTIAPSTNSLFLLIQRASQKFLIYKLEA